MADGTIVQYNNASPGLIQSKTNEQQILINQSLNNSRNMVQEQNQYQYQGNQMINPHLNYSLQMYNQPMMNQNMMQQPNIQHFGMPQTDMQMSMTQNLEALMQSNIQANLPANIPQQMHSNAHGNFMQNMQPVMQANMNQNLQQNSHMVQGYQMDHHANNGNNRKHHSNNNSNKSDQHQHQQTMGIPSKIPTYTVDLSNPSSRQKFMDARKEKIVDRIRPALTEKYQKDDLEFSIKQIKNDYENKIKELNDKQQEVWQEYFKEHHKVTLSQVKEIFKFWQKTIQTHKDVSIDHDIGLQQRALEIFNDIIINNASGEHTHDEEIVSHYAQMQMMNQHPYNNFYQPQPEMMQNTYVAFPTPIRIDLDNFLKEIQSKKYEMKDSREHIINKVQKIIDEIPHIEYAEIYGSYQTNLDLPWSDIDFVIYSSTFGSHDCLEDLNQKFEKIMKEDNWIKKIDYISSAYVPIIKMVTEADSFEIKVDITFKDETHRGSDCVRLVKQYMMEYHLLSHMVMILKHILKVHNLNDPYSGGISSYALTLMIVAFLQLHFIILRQGQNYFYNFLIDHTDLVSTLSQFLWFYGCNIDFKHTTIHPWSPGDLSHNPIYTQYIAIDAHMLIVDPLNIENNVGKSSFNIEEIKRWFADAYNFLNLTPINTLDTYHEWEENVFSV